MFLTKLKRNFQILSKDYRFDKINKNVLEIPFKYIYLQTDIFFIIQQKYLPMEIPQIKKLILITTFVFALVACKKEEDYVGTETMLVASRISVVDPPQSELGSKFYAIKAGNDKNWKFYRVYTFEGFEHKEGYESLIVVKVYSNFSDNEPIMDAPKYRYKLKKIISQVQKDSEGLPF